MPVPLLGLYTLIHRWFYPAIEERKAKKKSWDMMSCIKMHIETKAHTQHPGYCYQDKQNPLNLYLTSSKSHEVRQG